MERIRQALKLAKAQKTNGKETLYDNPKAIQLGSPQQPINYTKTRILNSPASILKRNRIIANTSQRSQVAAAYKVLRTQVLQRLNTHSWNSLGIVSTNQTEGKTLTAINLAISLAKEVRHTVLLVDFDLASPTVHQYLGFSVQKGLSDYLQYNTPLEELLFNPSIDGLVVLPGNKPLDNSSEILSSPKIINLVDELQNRYPSRIIIFDLPALLSGDDVLAFSPYVNAILVVIEDGKTGQEDLFQAMEYLQTTNILGTVLNKSGAQKKVL